MSWMYGCATQKPDLNCEICKGLGFYTHKRVASERYDAVPCRCTKPHPDGCQCDLCTRLKLDIP